MKERRTMGGRLGLSTSITLMTRIRETSKRNNSSLRDSRCTPVQYARVTTGCDV